MAFSCSKCNEWIQSVNLVTEGGKTYYFCDDCYDIAKELPTNEFEFFCRKSSEYVKDKIDKAKERREKGGGKWKINT